MAFNSEQSPVIYYVIVGMTIVGIYILMKIIEIKNKSNLQKPVITNKYDDL
jgi:hypothetical protein